jgi:alkyl sulfatase BDS1-like metallo-beta-lactamase superfamily hydrolase
VWTDRTQNELSATPTQQSYAQYMGGVDRLDQMSRVNKEKKSLRWYRKI